MPSGRTSGTRTRWPDGRDHRATQMEPHGAGPRLARAEAPVAGGFHPARRSVGSAMAGVISVGSLHCGGRSNRNPSSTPPDTCKSKSTAAFQASLTRRTVVISLPSMRGAFAAIRIAGIAPAFCVSRQTDGRPQVPQGDAIQSARRTMRRSTADCKRALCQLLHSRRVGHRHLHVGAAQQQELFAISLWPATARRCASSGNPVTAPGV